MEDLGFLSEVKTSRVMSEVVKNGKYFESHMSKLR